ncbi:type 1 fimbrial protein [Citrobacter amalonaticus]|uniref:Type 1 fimbrial protein n=1 Tax=Citrobacter amalonaticus TaxID=35703 RepID=A0A8I0SZ08_CITAM|nr:type 1 fimbrial protein [Citrobacter amalonaticus]MBE0128819.1 type 1 fimbrial protein [Citrobacter amalonaticus]HAU5066680.1 type 1 fimbrial protein [Citrobacter amalonaticus]
MPLPVTRKTSLLLLALLALYSFTAIADAGRQGGVIRFTGQIVEPPCNVSQQQQRLAMSCYNEGRTQTHYYSPQELLKAPQHFKQIAAVNLRYLDEKKKLAVMDISYH